MSATPTISAIIPTYREAATAPTVVHQCALGAGLGTVGLAVRNDRPGTQRASVGGATTTVPQLPGDRLRPPDVLKIDVEGAELAVLDGLDRTLSRAPPRVIYIEGHGTERCATLADRLTAAGYRITDEFGVGTAETLLRARRCD